MIDKENGILKNRVLKVGTKLWKNQAHNINLLFKYGISFQEKEMCLSWSFVIGIFNEDTYKMGR
jgi:hypothetical protein